MTSHLATRKTWRCIECGRPWPCYHAKDALLTEYAEVPTALVLYMAAAFAEAALDLRDRPADQLYFRFLGWLQLRRPSSPPQAPWGTGASGDTGPDR